MVPAAEHALSLGRLALAVWVVCELEASPASAWVLPAVVLACATDFFDGRIARARGPVRALGRWIDNLCDIAFLSACFLAFAWAGAFAVGGHRTTAVSYLGMVPLFALVLSFGSYATRALVCALFGRHLAPSRLGHRAGIANYILALIGGIVVHPALGLPGSFVTAALVAVVALNIAAAAQNVVLLARVTQTRA